MSKPTILVQLDTDPQPSVFDSVVAVDAGAEQLFRHGGITAATVRDLVYGCIFTRSPDELRNTAIFVGGSNVEAGDQVLRAITQLFFGPMRVSVMIDCNGANTTAAAAVLAVARHLPLAGSKVLVLAATGPVGKRVVRLLARQRTIVNVASRTYEKAVDVCGDIGADIPGSQLHPFSSISPDGMAAALDGVQAIIAAGAPGVPLMDAATMLTCRTLKVAIDLSAVPPEGLEGVKPHDKGTERDGMICYGALGVGGTKMKIHKAAVQQLFSASNLVLDAEEILAIGQRL